MSDLYAHVWEVYIDRVNELGLDENTLWEAGLMAVYERGRLDA